MVIAGIPAAGAVLCALLAGAAATGGGPNGMDRTATQWRPVVEWSLSNPTCRGNPFDLEAAVTFVHPESGETHTTGMFYAGGDTWKFRLTGTRPGRWTFTTRSTDPDLDGRRRFIFYREEADSIRMDLTGMAGPQPAVAVDTLKPYAELDLGTLPPGVHTWKAPYVSDWAIAVGEFAEKKGEKGVGPLYPVEEQGTRRKRR